MENLIGQRIKDLRSYYNLGLKEFSEKCGLSHVAVFHLENGKTLKPHKNSLQRIASTYGTSADWILYGHSEMLPQGAKNIYAPEREQDMQWKEEAYHELKSKTQLLEKEVERLWQIISHITAHSTAGIRSVMKAG